MRDSALKLDEAYACGHRLRCRRRAHARQRFETMDAPHGHIWHGRVGEELMRDSALKPANSVASLFDMQTSEKSSCATAL